jgi:hypothetical protein
MGDVDDAKVKMADIVKSKIEEDKEENLRIRTMATGLAKELVGAWDQLELDLGDPAVRTDAPSTLHVDDIELIFHKFSNTSIYM